MIPVNPLAMMLGLLLLLVSLACLVTLLVVLGACLHPRGRRFVRARPKRFMLLSLLLVIGCLPGLQYLAWEWQDWREQRALNPRLESDQVLGDLQLPAGTRIRMARLEPDTDWEGNALPYGLHSLRRAEFDEVPGQVRGVQVRRLELNDEQAEVELAAASRIDGWQCSAEAPVTFHYPPGAQFHFADWQLQSCTLAPGSEVAGVTWPGAMTVQAVGNGRWQLATDDTPVRLLGLPVRLWNLWLDAPYGLLQDWQAELTEPLELGPMQYPTGTRVRGFRGHLLFSPNAEAPAMDKRDGQPLKPDLSVEQSAEGDVLGIHNNLDVGVFDWFKVVP